MRQQARRSRLHAVTALRAASTVRAESVLRDEARRRVRKANGGMSAGRKCAELH